MALLGGGYTAVGITLAIILCMGIFGFVLNRLSRNRQAKHNTMLERSQEEGRLSKALKRVPSKPPQLPVFKTRSSLSMSSASNSPKTPKSPGIRFTVTSPSHHSRRSASIDSLPSVETVLERFEKEEDANAAIENKAGEDEEQDEILEDGKLGEPGPAVPTVNFTSGPPLLKQSLWDRPNIGLGHVEKHSTAR